MVIRHLYGLQELDLEIEEKGEALAQVERDLGKDYGINQAKEEVEGKKKEVADLEKEQRWYEWQLEDLNSKIKDTEKRLYSGRITNPKELLSMQEDVARLKVRYREHEDKLLEIMMNREEAERILQEKMTTLQGLEAQWQRLKSELLQKQQHLKVALEELKQKRMAIASLLDPSSLTLYEEIKREKHTAVAKVEQGRCCGCRLSLSLAELQRARSGLTRCSSCGRILYLS